MTTDRDPAFEGKRTEQVNVQPPSRVESQASGRAHPDAPSKASVGTILTSCVLAFLMGGAGAWAYVNYLDPMLAKQRVQKSQPDAQKSESKSSDFAARLNDLSGKLDELQSRVDWLPKAISAQDIEPLKERLAMVDELSRKVDSLGLRVNSLPGKVDQDSRMITTLTADMERMRNEVASLRHNIHTSASAEKPSSRGEKPSDKGEKLKALVPSEPPREIPPPVSTLLQAGVEFFQKKNYAEASDFFAGLIKTQPDDARVWYYAALSRGLATRDWKGETERLVTQGVDREKAGKPSKSQIDAAFADLTPETGKDWLAFYRRRAG
jgi:TolA-binding protein